VGEDMAELNLETVPCLLCESGEYDVLFVGRDLLLGLPGEFTVVKCRSCGFVYTNPRPTAESLALYCPSNYYHHYGTQVDTAQPQSPSLMRRLRLAVRNVTLDSHYGYHLSGWQQVARPVKALGWIATLPFRAHLRQVPPMKGAADGTARVLEIGCATGRYLDFLRSLGWEVHGVDIDRDAVQLARDRLGLDVFLGTLEEARYPDAYFNAVVMWMVLEHLPDPVGTLQEVHRTLVPKGRLHFSVPNINTVEIALFGRRWFAWELPRHLSHFTPDSLQRLLEKTRFQLLGVDYPSDAGNLRGGARYVVRDFQASRPGMCSQLLSLFITSKLFEALLKPVACALALCRQIGRITVYAQKV
jgi:SAM-dependent methyltransferase